MIAIRKKFKSINGKFEETELNHKIGYVFQSESGLNYRMILSSFIFDDDNQIFKFSFALWMQDPISLIWSFVKNDEIKADTNLFRDSEGNLYFDSGDNEDLNNAYIYSNEIEEEEGVIIRNARIKTLKAGLMSEYDIFYNNILLGVCEPEIAASIVYQNLNGITEIV
jgi:hypothetical protein